MIAVFLNSGNIITGWLPNLESEEEIEGLNYVLFDELPTEITNNVNGDILVIDKDTKEITVLVTETEPVSNKDVKIQELNAACNAAILAGFTSDALGSDNTYDFDYDAQINLGGMLNAITAGIVSGDIIWKASGIPQLHTIEQFKIVFSDGLTHKNTNIGKYWTLKGQVLSAESTEEINAIVW